MSAGSCCRRPALTVKRRETLRAAARQMEREEVGALVVLDDGRPVAVLTDRDLALRVLAGGLDPSVPVGDFVGDDFVAVGEDLPLRLASAEMQRHGVRRLPVVDGAGAAVGMLSADDLVRLASQELAALADVAAEQSPPRVRASVGPPGCARGARHYAKAVTSVRSETPVREVARRMQGEGVGCVVVVDDGEVPRGLVTDRDLAVRVVAGALDPETPVAKVMSAPLATVEASENLQTVARRMSDDGVRRLPVVEERRLIGIVTYDDLLVGIGSELHDLGQAALEAIARRHRSGPGA
jgi:CBS domain-containing protein